MFRMKTLSSVYGMRGPSLSNVSSMTCVSSEFCLKWWCTHHDNAFYWLNRLLSSRLWHPIIPREFGWRDLVTIYVFLWHMIGSPDQMEPPASTRTWNRVWSFTATTGFCFVPFWSRWISAGFSLKFFWLLIGWQKFQVSFYWPNNPALGELRWLSSRPSFFLSRD